jgi:hypothetical protein
MQLKIERLLLKKDVFLPKMYQEINSVAKPTATRDLSELTDTYKIFKNSGVDAGSIYELVT